MKIYQPRQKYLLARTLTRWLMIMKKRVIFYSPVKKKKISPQVSRIFSGWCKRMGRLLLAKNPFCLCKMVYFNKFEALSVPIKSTSPYFPQTMSFVFKASCFPTCFGLKKSKTTTGKHSNKTSWYHPKVPAAPQSGGVHPVHFELLPNATL